MPRRVLLLLMVLTSVGTASTNPLGMEYSEWFGAESGIRMATDNTGALYFSGFYALASGMSASSVTKVSADGSTIVWQNKLGYLIAAMAVSPSGDVFVVPQTSSSAPAVSVAKLSASGSGFAWTATAVLMPQSLQSFPPVLAADAQGRTYVAAPQSTNGGATMLTTVVRVNAAGSAVDYSATVSGWPTSIAASASGVVVAGEGASGVGFVSQLAVDGSGGYYTPLPQDGFPTALALDSGGNAVVFGQGLLQRLNQAGAITVSTSILGAGTASALGLDGAGNAYVVGVIGQLYPVRNSLATCLPATAPTRSLPTPGEPPATIGTAPILTVVAPDGSVAQITYLPGAAFEANGLDTLALAVGPNSTLFVATTPAYGFVPSRQGPFPEGFSGTSSILSHWSAQAAARTVSLACVGNGATYAIYPVAPGEIVVLTGNGLGPAQGTATQATMQSPFPAEAAGVQVTFDGTPAPLLWVQDSQINAIVPWSVAAGTKTEICVLYGATKSNCLTWPVSQTAPGVFTVDGVHAAALNQDGSINSASNPASPGSIVSVFATGLGPINPPSGDGMLVGFPLPSNVLQTVAAAETLVVSPPFGSMLASSPVPATYAGPAPYLAAGVSQINFQLSSAIGFYLAPGGLDSLNLPSSTSSQTFKIYATPQQ